MSKAIELLEKVVEAQYQKVDGYCPWCGAKDYPVCGDKQGYDEVEAEDAEEWQIDHSEDCIVTYLDQALAILKEQPPAGEFTRRARLIATHCPSKPRTVMEECILDLCTRLDRSEASRKELLTACEIALPFVVAHDIMQKVVSGAALQLQTAIKANKQGD